MSKFTSHLYVQLTDWQETLQCSFATTRGCCQDNFQRWIFFLQFIKAKRACTCKRLTLNQFLNVFILPNCNCSGYMKVWLCLFHSVYSMSAPVWSFVSLSDRKYKNYSDLFYESVQWENHLWTMNFDHIAQHWISSFSVTWLCQM